MNSLFAQEDRPAQLRAAIDLLVKRRPFGGYNLIVADPPWEILMRSDKGYEKSPQRHYACVPTEVLASLQVGLLASPNAILLLWCTWPMLEQQLDVLRAWGFRYASGAPWFKGSPASEGDDPDDPRWNAAFGGGYIFRSCSEPLLIGVRGQPTLLPQRRSLRAAFFTPVREHSRKPDEIYKHAEALSPGPFLELFSRTNRDGWTAFGDEAGRFGVVT